jgi:hypothetical protein
MLTRMRGFSPGSKSWERVPNAADAAPGCWKQWGGMPLSSRNRTVDGRRSEVCGTPAATRLSDSG